MTSDFEYDLPPELIAQEPLPERSASRMMVLHRDAGLLENLHVEDLPDFLQEHDLLVLNNTKVFPARLVGHRADTGGKVELLLLEEVADGVWSALCRAGWRARKGIKLIFGEGEISGEIIDVGEAGQVNVRLSCGRSLSEAIEDHGRVPLPPYIKRDYTQRHPVDRQRYQTIYARMSGAVAAPTAGLHFSDRLFSDISRKGVDRAFITLHVGPGTFRPVSVDKVGAHKMESERYVVNEGTAGAVNTARGKGGRIVAVGSTSVRTLETVAVENGRVVAGEGRSSLFIRPGYEFRVVDLLLTNFHLPRSTLLMMVCAFAGTEFVLGAYREAVKQNYRFYSYGDCMLIV